MEDDRVCNVREHAKVGSTNQDKEFSSNLSTVVAEEDIFFTSQNTEMPNLDEVQDDQFKVSDESSEPVAIADHVEQTSRSNSSSTLGGIVQGLLGCLRPVWTILGKGSQKEDKLDSWTIPFEEIRELQWLGSGAQGAVFLGVFGGEQVAVKKVRHQKDTEIRHLRHLDHQNIIRFR